MMLYLQGHSRPEILFAVLQCACYTFNPRLSHEVALKCIDRYLKGTRTRGLILSPFSDLTIDCYIDSNFSGSWSYEDDQDPTCVRSRTEFIMFVANFPVIWSSKIQTEIALSTMEADYIALSTVLKSLIPLKRLVKAISLAADLDPRKVSNIKTEVDEDNQGFTILAKLEHLRMTLRSKHYALKYHWFRSELKSNNISIVSVASTDQCDEITTKELRCILFEVNRFKVSG